MLTLALLTAMTAIPAAMPNDNSAIVLPEQVTYITPALYEQWDPKVDDAVVATFPGRHVNPERVRLDPEGKAPQWLIVRHRDGLFGIDPFTALPTRIDNNTMRQIFKPVKYGTTGPTVTLDTDQSLYGWRRTERTEELFRALETARVLWLKKSGYIGSVRSFSGDPAKTEASTELPQPRMIIPVPDDKPRTKPMESVEKSTSRSIVLSGDEPVKISLPDLGISAETRDRVAARNERAAKQAEAQKQAVAQKKTDQTVE